MPCARAGDFEIHVAVVVFGAGDVGEDGVVLAFQHQAHGNTADVSGQRSARIHQGERSAADRGLRARTVGFEDVANHAHGVGELVFAGDQRGERTLGESAVADFAAAGSTHEAGFADAERREVVVQHEALAGFARFQEFDALRIVLGAEGDRDQRLGFAAGEEGGTVGARQNAGFDGDLADLIEGAAVGTAVVLQHLIAEDALFESRETPGAFFALLFGQGFDHALLEGGDQRVAFQLLVLRGIHRVGQVCAGILGDLIVNRLIQDVRDEFALLLAGQLHQFADAGGDLLAALMPELDGAEDLGFGDLLCAGFHHHDAFFGAGHHDVQLRFAALRIGGVGNVFAVLHADANSAQHVGEGNFADRQSRRRARDGERVRILFGVGRQDHGDDLGFVQKALGEQRADRTIDQAAGEDFFFRGAALAFNESARDLAGGVGVLSIIDGEREEPGPHLRLVSHTSGDEYHGVTGTNDNSAARLLGHFTRLQGDLTAAQVYFNYVMHSFLNLQHSAGNQFR